MTGDDRHEAAAAGARPVSAGARWTVVRPAAFSDAAALAAVRIASWRAAYRGIVPDEALDGLDLDREAVRWRERLAASGSAWTRAGWLVAPPAAPRLAGFVVAGPGRHPGEDGLGEVYAIYVDPDAQGRGVGSALMAAAVRGLATRGFREAVLWVFEANAAARRFYQHLGWAPDGAAKPFEIGGAAPIELRYRRRLDR